MAFNRFGGRLLYIGIIMSMNKAQSAFTYDISLLIQYVRSLGWSCRLEWAYRDATTQAELVKRGLSKTLKSKHIDRLACDFTFFAPSGSPTWEKESLQRFGDYWESLSEFNEWGGNWESFVDTPHFQRNYK